MLRTTIGTKTALSVLFGAASVLMAGNIEAASAGVSGAICGPLSIPPESINATGLVRQFNGIQNQSNTGRTIVCPISRNNSGSTNGISEVVTLTRATSSSANAFFCIALATDQSGNTTGAVSGNQSVTQSGFNFINFPNLGTAQFGTVSIACGMGPGDTLKVINSTEF